MRNFVSIARYARKIGIHSAKKPVTFYADDANDANDANDADDAANAKQYLFQGNKPAGNT